MNTKTQYHLILVEGAHDLAFITTVLKKKQKLNEIKQGLELQYFPNEHRFWENLFPKQIKKFHELVRFPSIIHNTSNTLSICVKQMGGKSNLENEAMQDIFKVNSEFKTEISSLGIILDADDADINRTFENIKKTLENIFDSKSVPQKLGTVPREKLRIGVYIFPDNNSQGTLEDALLSCVTADHVFSKLRGESEKFIDDALKNKEYKNYVKDFEINKAKVAAMVSVLKPGKTNTVSISDNDWFDAETIDKSEPVKNFYRFLLELLGIAEV